MNDLTPGAGHNNPPIVDPAILEEAKKIAHEAVAEADKIVLPIKDKHQAEEIGDTINKLRTTFKKVDTMRADAKKPHDEASKAVQKAFTVFLDALTKSAEKLKGAASQFLREEQARLDREAEERRIAARKAQEEEEARLRLAESRGDTMAVAAAEQALQEANKAVDKTEREPAKATIGSATGGGRTIAQRTTKTAKITNLRALFMHFEQHPEVFDTLQRLANAAVRDAGYQPGSVPGIDPKPVETLSAA